MKAFHRLILIAAVLLGSLHSFGQESLHVAVSGKGKQAAILIPGFTCPGSVWDETVRQLSTQYTCYVITFAGFAGEPAQQDPHLKAWVADIAAYINQKHLDKPVIIGHSIGGGIAMMVAAGYPQLVSKIVVVDALPCLAALQNPSFKVQPDADCSPFIIRFTTMSDSALRKQQVASAPMMSTDSITRHNIVDWSLKSDRKTMGQIYCEFLNTDLRDTIAAIHCPACILLEPSFKMYSDAMQQQFAKLPNKQIVYATKGLHFIMNDDREWYLAQIKTFLQ